MSDPFDIPRLRRELQTSSFGRTVEYADRLTSTNDWALDLARQGAVEGTVILADEQTAGRGRLGRAWDSAPGVGLWASLILRPPASTAFLPALTLCAACAVAAAIEDVAGVPAGLKWPNDVVIGGRKVAGLLAETKTLAGVEPPIILGIGINVNHDVEGFPPPLRAVATSLRIETGRVIPRQRVLQRLLERFEPLYAQFLQAGLTPFMPALVERSVLITRRVAITDGSRTLTGTAVGLDEVGGLIIETSNQGRVHVHSGTVSLRE
ncbi:MAG: biotin--[acetyl-CoA-carboxylase] ligase [Candidatus Latescibacteria bacterium]|nr:biotin--[acetyl-CoA-carboxylase] ligase [Candidatus Latescibacterota bacterium]